MTRALNSPAPEPTRRATQRSRRIALGAAALVVVGGATAAATFQAITSDAPLQAGCYETLAADADTTEASPELVRRVGHAEACRATWEEVGADVDTSNLVSCLNPHGGRGVFPAPVGATPAEACSQIGWQADTDGS